MIYTPEVREDLQELFDNTRHCLHCGKSLVASVGDDYQIHQGYCSRKHYELFPPRLALIEKRYGKPAKQAIIEVLNEYQTLEVASGFLFMTPQQLGKYLRKLNIRKVVQYE